MCVCRPYLEAFYEVVKAVTPSKRRVAYEKLEVINADAVKFLKAQPSDHWQDCVAAAAGHHTGGRIASGFAESANARLGQARYKDPLQLIDHVLGEPVMVGPDGYCAPRDPPHFDPRSIYSSIALRGCIYSIILAL